MDDVEKLAREALAESVGCWTDDYSLKVGLSRSDFPSERALSAIKSAILAERERCAGVAERFEEEVMSIPGQDDLGELAGDIVTAIRNS